MAAVDGPSASWELPAAAPAVGELRRHAGAFAAGAGVSPEVVDDVVLAVSETVTNVILHAYRDREGVVTLSCRSEAGRLVVEVADDGLGITGRSDSSGIGHGLTLVGALADSLQVVPGARGRGTTVVMSFGAGTSPEPPAGADALCALAVETIADVACVDAVHDGVLRRVGALVAGDPELSDWLLAAPVPAKPGTATWAALREGGARLVVHDASIRRSPGGPGERLDLTWWIALPLADAGGTPVALWGLGGRRGGRQVPTADVLRTLTGAARGDLERPAERAILRARLVSDPREAV